MDIEGVVLTDSDKRLGALDVLHRDVIEIKAVLRELTTAITKLAVVEERQSQTSMALERCFRLIESVEKRVAALEIEKPSTNRLTKAADMLLIGAVVLIVVYILKHVGLQ